MEKLPDKKIGPPESVYPLSSTPISETSSSIHSLVPTNEITTSTPLDPSRINPDVENSKTEDVASTILTGKESIAAKIESHLAVTEATPQPLSRKDEIANLQQVVGRYLTTSEIESLYDFLNDKEKMQPYLEQANSEPNGVYIPRGTNGIPPRSISLCKEGETLRTFVELKTFSQLQGDKTSEAKIAHLHAQGLYLGSGAGKEVRRALLWGTNQIIVSGRIKDPKSLDNAISEAQLQKEFGTGLGVVRYSRDNNQGSLERVVQFTELANLGDGELLVYDNFQWNQWTSSQRKEAVIGAFENIKLLHERGYLNHDIKGRNLLFNQDTQGHIQVICNDLDMATKIDDPEGVYKGTPEFWSPDYLQGDNRGTEDDAYAMGALLWGMTHEPPPSTDPYSNILGDDAIGLPPWHRESLEEIRDGLGRFFLKDFDKISSNYDRYKEEIEVSGHEVDRVILALMHPDKEKRITVATALSQLQDMNFDFKKLPYTVLVPKSK